MAKSEGRAKSKVAKAAKQREDAEWLDLDGRWRGSARAAFLLGLHSELQETISEMSAMVPMSMERERTTARSERLEAGRFE